MQRFEGQKTFYLGRLGASLYLLALVSMGWIGFSYSLFPNYTVPILLIIAFSIGGLVLAFATGNLRISVLPLSQTFVLTGLLGVGTVLGLNILLNIFTSYAEQDAVLTQSSIILGLPIVVAVAFFSFVGVLEEVFWSSIYIVLRTFSRGKNILFIMVIVALGGMIYHLAVAQQMYIGSIFSAPEYFVWIGLSWIFYRVMLELTGHMGVSMLTHMTWNMGITLINQGVIVT